MYVIVSIKRFKLLSFMGDSEHQTKYVYELFKSFNSRETSVVICTDLSGKEPHRQVGVAKVVTSGSLDGVMVSPLAQNHKRCGFDSHSRCNISHFHHPHDNSLLSMQINTCNFTFFNYPSTVSQVCTLSIQPPHPVLYNMCVYIIHVYYYV